MEIFSLLLLLISVAMLGLRFLPPRESLRKLARRPGFVAMLSLTTLAGLRSIKYRVWTYGPGGKSPGIYYFIYEAIEPLPLATAVFLVWLIVAIQGFRWKHRDWIENLGLVLGCIWIVYGILLIPIPIFILKFL
jgi:hypothetical protein